MAGSINKVILVGNLGRDPETRRTTAGDPIVNFSVATSESWRDKQSGERRGRAEEVLQVIEHQQRATALAQPIDDRLQRRAGAIALGADCGGHGGQHLFGRGRGGQPHQPHTARMLIERRGRDDQCQTRLANPAPTRQRHQPLSLDQERASDPLKVVVTAHERRRPRR